MKKNRRTVAWLPALAAVLVALPPFATAQDQYPSRLVRIIVPFAAGTVADHFPRIVAERLAERWRQPVIVENRVGASGNIGAEAVARAEPDGYTLLASAPPPLAINQSLFPKLAFDPAAFVPITVLCSVPNVLVANPHVPASNVSELLAYARAHPDHLSYGSTGNGGTPHLTAERLKRMGGVRIVHVPYRSVPQATIDMLAGRVDIMFANLGGVLPNIKEGKLKALAVASAERVDSLPGVPTMQEAIPGFVSVTWFAVVAPPGTPAAIADQLALEMRAILGLPEVVERYRQLGATPVGSSPAETATFLKQESERWGEVIRSAGIKPD